jgi:hypothetical protein
MTSDEKMAAMRRLISNFETNFPCVCGTDYRMDGDDLPDPTCAERHEIRMWLHVVAPYKLFGDLFP